jgi:hypothetical protein
MSTLINDAPELRGISDQIAALGYKSAQQIAEAHAASPDALEQYLDIDHIDLMEMLRPYRLPMLFAGPGRKPSRRFTFGALLDGVERPMLSLMRPPGLASTLPPRVSHLSGLPPVWHQGVRGTCVAHAAAAVVQRFWQRQQAATDVSMQYLYWDCKQNDRYPNNEGTFVKTAMECLQHSGCCKMATWPYEDMIISGNVSHNPPPPLAVQEAPNYKIPYFKPVTAKSISDLKLELAEGRCIAFSIPAFRYWVDSNDTIDTGVIANPAPGEREEGGHAMCMVGYEDQPTETGLGGGVFYIRNSWGTEWAQNSILGLAGYGTIPYSYINAHCVEAYSIG